VSTTYNKVFLERKRIKRKKKGMKNDLGKYWTLGYAKSLKIYL
jgi:hypothetical protein